MAKTIIYLGQKSFHHQIDWFQYQIFGGEILILIENIISIIKRTPLKEIFLSSLTWMRQEMHGGDDS